MRFEIEFYLLQLFFFSLTTKTWLHWSSIVFLLELVFHIDGNTIFLLNKCLCLQPKMIGYIMPLFNTIRMIHSVSRYYNTSEKLSALLIKVSYCNTSEKLSALLINVSYCNTSETLSALLIKVSYCNTLETLSALLIKVSYCNTSETLSALLIKVSYCNTSE